MSERVARLNFVALLVVVVYATTVTRLVAANQIVNPVVDALIVFVTSVQMHQLIVHFLFRLVPAVQLLMKLYWGHLYVAGFWSYTYTLDGRDDGGKIYFGVWRFDQNLYNTRVVGFGLTDNFHVRSRVRSMTDMIGNGDMHEFVNIRNDSEDPATEYYSRTNMYFELNKDRLLRCPIRMRGKTIVYGGPRNGLVCNNVFLRHKNARTEQDVIDELRENMLKYGFVHPGVVQKAPEDEEQATALREPMKQIKQ